MTTETISCPCCGHDYETTGVYASGEFEADDYPCETCGWLPNEPDPPPFCEACGETGHDEEGCEEDER